MNAVTVRAADKKLLCFGPDDGMYDPGVPAGATKSLEDYAAVSSEWSADRALDPKPLSEAEQFRAQFLSLLADPLVKAAVKDVVK